jgi:hypothetical protein
MRPVDPSRAYEKLDAILARDEYQGYVSPFAWLSKAITWFTEWFPSLPMWLQITVLAILLVILGAILLHFVTVLGKIMRAGPTPEPEAAHAAARVADLPPWADLVRQARAALEAGDRSEALRLYYLAVLARLRERGRIPVSTALTGREILAATRPPLPGLGEATTLFERCAYGAEDPDPGQVAAVQRLGEGAI